MKPVCHFGVALLVAVAALTVPLRATVPVLLDEALKKERSEQGRWAFTESMEMRDAKGKVEETLVVRCDPSKPYAEQYTPLSENGKAPSKKKIREFRERGEKEALVREKAAADAEKAGDGVIPIQVDSDAGVIDLDQAVVAAEDERQVTFKIPVRAVTKSKIPFDQIDVRISVEKTTHALATIKLGLSAPFRVKLIAKVRSVELSAEFLPVSDEFPPAMAKAEIHSDVSILMIRSNQRISLVRSDFKRVKPYDERFTVKNGPLKMLGF